MKLRNVLVVVKDIEKAKEFYNKVFGLDMILNSDGNVIMTEGLVLQEEAVWKDCLGKDVVNHSNSSELYFEESNIEEFVKKLEELYPDTEYVTKLTTFPNGKSLVRFYDLDGNMIEVGTP